jgi:hypothetical protein
MTTPKQTPANTRGNDHLASHLGAGSGGLEPASAQGSLAVVGVLACLAASAAALAVAPILMPTSYSWVAHTTSESAAQGVPGAWLARLGFVTFGFAVLAVAGLARHLWGRLWTCPW